MHHFSDSTGARWEIAINVGLVKRVRSLLSVDLSKLLQEGAKEQPDIADDICLFVDVLWVLCEQQAKERGMSDEQFGQSLGGDSLADAMDAFREELIDFFPSSKARPTLRKLAAKRLEIAERLIARSAADLDAINPDEEAAKIAKQIGSMNLPTPSPVIAA